MGEPDVRPLPNDPCETYLESARLAGMAHRLGKAECVLGLVAGGRGVSDCLVEYCPPSVWSDATALDDLSELASSLLGPLRRLIIRVPGRTAPAGRAEPMITYLWHGGPQTCTDDGPVVGPARPDELVVVEGWLVEALRGGYDDADEQVDDAALAAAVGQLLMDPTRVSFVAHDDARPLGHATILTDARDELTGAEYVELFDVLAVDGPGQAEARKRLTDAALRHAVDMGRVLVGNVSHGAPGSAAGVHSREVAQQLQSRGWHVWYTLWTRPVELSNRSA